jgi:hypothetical protein
VQTTHGDENCVATFRTYDESSLQIYSIPNQPTNQPTECTAILTIISNATRMHYLSSSPLPSVLPCYQHFIADDKKVVLNVSFVDSATQTLLVVASEMVVELIPRNT